MTTTERIEKRNESDIAGLVATYGPTGENITNAKRGDVDHEKH